ncbi:MAG TPA: hypothetical protein VD761_01125 [Solirubrobacterales bacterium]|nr:hypothetical protein [Solirubrobacterales bacterium]
MPGTGFLYPVDGNTCRMDVLLYIVGLVVMGLIIGALARLLLPGRDPMSMFETMLVGIGGSLVAGLIGYYVFDNNEGAGFFFSLICAIAIVYIVRKSRERSAPRRL